MPKMKNCKRPKEDHYISVLLPLPTYQVLREFAQRDDRHPGPLVRRVICRVCSDPRLLTELAATPSILA